MGDAYLADQSDVTCTFPVIYKSTFFGRLICLFFGHDGMELEDGEFLGADIPHCKYVEFVCLRCGTTYMELEE